MRAKSRITSEQAREMYETILPETRKWFWQNHPSGLGANKKRMKYSPTYYVKFYRRFLKGRNEDFIVAVMAKNAEFKAESDAKLEKLQAALSIPQVDVKPKKEVRHVITDPDIEIEETTKIFSPTIPDRGGFADVY